jgi:hypothetical protein
MVYFNWLYTVNFCLCVIILTNLLSSRRSFWIQTSINYCNSIIWLLVWSWSDRYWRHLLRNLGTFNLSLILYLRHLIWICFYIIFSVSYWTLNWIHILIIRICCSLSIVINSSSICKYRTNNLLTRSPRSLSTIQSSNPFS